jgi:sugar lactone lactonase YvrE
MARFQGRVALFALTRVSGSKQGVRRRRTAIDSAQALGTGVGRHRAAAGRRGALTLAWLSVFALAGLFTAASAPAGFTHPVVSEFTGSDTPAGSLGSEAEKLAIRQSTGDVYVIASSQGLVDRFDASGNYLSQITGFPSFGGDPDLAVDNSGTLSEGNLYVKPEFNPLFAFDASGTLLYQLNGTPSGSFGDVCGTAVDSNGDLYLGDYSNSAIQKFDSLGNYLTTIPLSFRPCDLAVDTDGTIYAIAWNQALHKVDPATGMDLGIIDGDGPRAVNIDPSTHDVYSAHQTFVRQFDSSGTLLSEFGADLLANTRGVDISGSTGNVYVSTNPSGGSRVIIFGPLGIVPDVTTGNATNVTGTSATLNGHVDPAGGTDIIDCHFEYGTDTSYGSSAPCVPATPIGSPTDVSADISGLSTSTLYHFRLVAGNSLGSVAGDDSTFVYSFMTFIDSFGSPGTEAGQFQTPVGVAVHQSSGAIYVADSGNARVQKFNNKAKFEAAWGWGVDDGMEESEVCTSHCQAGIPGSGPGQFDNPRSIAVGNAPGPSMAKVFVGDWGNDTVLKFDADGDYLATIDGSKTPQGEFVDLRGVAVDADGHLWVVDGQNVNEFDAKGKFVQQWENPFGSSTRAIAVDLDRAAVYLTNGDGRTDRFSLAGEDEATVDGSSGTALAVDPGTENACFPCCFCCGPDGNCCDECRDNNNISAKTAETPAFPGTYVDHGSNVVIYDAAGNQLDELITLGATTDSQGIAFRTSNGKSDKPGTLYVSDATNDFVAIYAPQPAGPPFITAQLARYAGSTNETLQATIVPMGYETTCTFQYVGDDDYMATGYDNATTLPCTPDSLGKSFDYQQASATATGLTLGDTYHFHAVAMNSKGTTVGADQTFVAGPGAWTPFNRCPVDDPAMLATDGVDTVSACLYSNSTHGSIQLGMLPGTETGNSNLQGGLVGSLNTFEFTFISPAGGALVGDPVEVTVMNLSATATVESAGTPTDFNLFAGISLGVPIITLPAKIHLENDLVGPDCYIGSEMNPMVLHPVNVVAGSLVTESFDADGTVDPDGILTTLGTTGGVQGDMTFAVPVAQGCANGTDPLINALVGLPSPSGANNLVLDDASSVVVFPISNSTGAILTGQELADAWHTGFGE